MNFVPILCQFWEDEWKEKKERSLAATVELKTSWKAGYNSLRPIEKPILAGDWQSNNLWWHLMSWRRLEAADWSIGRVDWSVDGTARLGSHLLMINWWLCLVIVDDVVTVAEFGGRWQSNGSDGNAAQCSPILALATDAPKCNWQMKRVIDGRASVFQNGHVLPYSNQNEKGVIDWSFICTEQQS